MRNFMHNLRLLFSTRTRHYEIAAPTADGGYIVYDGQIPTNYSQSQNEGEC